MHPGVLVELQVGDSEEQNDVAAEITENQVEDYNDQDESGEVEVVIHHEEQQPDEDSHDDLLDLGESGMEAVTDIDDPGYEIVTEDKSTNCPSLNGSLKKPPKRKNVNKEEPIPEVVDTKTGDDVDTKASDSKSQPLKRWSKLMKYTCPQRTRRLNQTRKTKKESL